MKPKPIAAIILAAGKGTRMRSARHKVLHEIGGKAMIRHLLSSLHTLEVARSVMVVGAGRDQLEGALGDEPLTFAAQEQQLGTGHAVQAAMPHLKDWAGPVLVLYGDTPLIGTDSLAALLRALYDTESKSPPAAAVLGFRPKEPGTYGRLVCDEAGMLERIVEYKDANAEERAITLCNSGVIAFDGRILPKLLGGLSNDNAKGEYYLTDTIALARKLNRTVSVVEAGEDELMGVNSRADLARAEQAFQDRMRRDALHRGVTLVHPESVFFSHDTVLHADVLIEPNVVFGPGVEVKSGAAIRAFSHLEGAVVEAGATVGPYARLRPHTHIGKGAKVGNFVEVKNATLGTGAKASHLSYLGDAMIGENANIGAGTITCNYDGFSKFKTDIGKGAFIGSNTALIAPVHVGEGAIIGAGSTISRDVGANALALTRAKQEERPGWAKRFRTKKATKAQQKKSKQG